MSPNPYPAPEPDAAVSFDTLCQEVERAVSEYISRHTAFDNPRPLAQATIRPYGLPGLWGLHTERPVNGEYDFRLRLEIMPRYTVADLDPMTDQPLH